MDVTLVEGVLASIATQVAGIINVLQPVGTALAGSFVILGIVMLGANMMVGGSFLSQIVRFTGAAAGTLWAILFWDQIVMETVAASRTVLGMFMPGYAGPSTLFAAAAKVVNRVMAEPAAWSWSVRAVIAFAQDILIAFCGLIIAIGMSFPGILSILAEINLMIGAAVAPLILGALAFNLTAPLGWGAINFMVGAGLRVIVLGLVSVLFSNAITAQIDLPGPDATMTFSAVLGLTLTSLVMIAAAIGANGIAGALVGGGLGTFGWSSVTHAVSVSQGAVSNAANIGGAVISSAASAARMAGGPAGSLAGAAVRSAGKITSSSSGSAFP